MSLRRVWDMARVQRLLNLIGFQPPHFLDKIGNTQKWPSPFSSQILIKYDERNLTFFGFLLQAQYLGINKRRICLRINIYFHKYHSSSIRVISSPTMTISQTPFIFLLLLLLFAFFTPTHQNVSVSLSKTTLSKSGDSVLIQWSGVDSPSKLDWLGIYSPPSSHHDNFIGYKFLSSSPTWKSGSGSISLPLVNLRSNYSFRIFRWTEAEVDRNHLDEDHNPLPGTAHLLATSDDELTFESGRGPDQIHLSYTDADDEMRVMFVTSDAGERSVRYGPSDDSLDDVAVAHVERYEREHMCDSPANASIGWRDPGFIHGAVMTRLKKGVRYYYKVQKLN